MKLFKSVLVRHVAPLGLVFGLALLGACSSSQQDDENLEASGDNSQGNLGSDDAGEGNGSESSVDEADASGGEGGADVNSATADEAAPPANGAGNPAAEPAPANAAPANAAPAPATAAAPAPAAPADGAPVAGGRVRYIKKGGAQIVSAPGGAPVGQLEQGDHPVTWEENGYYRVANGMYIPKSAVSEKGVPRARK